MHDIYRKESHLSRSIDEAEERLKNAADAAQKKSRQKFEEAKKLIDRADQQLHENPWPVVAGVAASCLLLGYYTGARSGK
jgi:ElaB/YqjD/DUF883 family membrane-anchored ribosome-binding protein